jgi:hypothetical protein
VAAPSSYHDFTGPEPLAYDVPGTDKGNEWKITKVSVSLPGQKMERRRERKGDGKITEMGGGKRGEEERGRENEGKEERKTC